MRLPQEFLLRVIRHALYIATKIETFLNQNFQNIYMLTLVYEAEIGFDERRASVEQQNRLIDVLRKYNACISDAYGRTSIMRIEMFNGENFDTEDLKRNLDGINTPFLYYH